MAQGQMADKTTGGAQAGKASSSSGLKTSASNAFPQRGQEADKLRWMQASVGNQATMQMMARRGAIAPIQRQTGAPQQQGQPTNTPPPSKLGLMRLKVGEAKTAGSFGQAEAFSAESGAVDNIGDTTEITGTGVGGQTDVYSDASDELKKAIKKGETNEQDVSSEKAEKAKIDRENQKLGVASGLLDVGSGFIGLINMKKAISESTKKSETAGALYGGLESGQKAFAGVAKVVDNAAKLEGNENGVGSSEAVAGYSGSVGDALSAIKSAFFMVKSIYELFKEGFSAEGVTKKEVIKGGLEAVQNGLEAAQSAVKTVKSILEILEQGVGKLTEAIPGIGIAISGIKITIKVFNMMQWHSSKQKMTTIKRDFKTKYATSSMVKTKNRTIFGKTIYSSTGTDKTALTNRHAELMRIIDPANATATADEKKEAQIELDDIENYELAKEMKNINNKKLVRGGIESGLEMASIAGDIATLSGAGAAVGVSLKAAASGTKVGMGLFRRVKQYGHNKAAEKGPNSAWSTVFNAEKSSDKKHEKRAKDADLILNMVGKLPEDETSADGLKQYQRVLTFIEATGCSTKALFRLNGNIDKQRKLLMESMKQRD
ncbi:hypothetical protein [Paenibacillus sp. PAMC21692]|uniref:hypothetical protein n=1 Tax=Paenibacillus sp. PAMC21692 TaxID=2762320 RepID=UPI00164DF27D|nr:hypothetical protein [Paenibacillus sp. PAMC21692]QNK54379.1 hypothetical protein H7F31_16995 [Paenibacillus sp. PAMC21692]